MITLISLGYACESIFVGEVVRDRVEFFNIFSEAEGGRKLHKTRAAKADTDVHTYVAWENKLSDAVPWVSAYFKVKATLILNINDNNAVLPLWNRSMSHKVFYSIKTNSKTIT